LKEYSIGLKDCNTAIQIDSTNEKAYCNRSHIYTKLKLFKKAILDMDKAIQLHPTKASYYLIKATLLNSCNESGCSSIKNYLELGGNRNKIPKKYIVTYILNWKMNKITFFIFLVINQIGFAQKQVKPIMIEGPIQGTTYHITYFDKNREIYNQKLNSF